MKLAALSLMQHKLRAALSTLGVVCGVSAVMAMLSVGEGAKRESLEQIEQLGTKNIYIRSVPLSKEMEARARLMRSRGIAVYDGERLKTGCREAVLIAYLKELRVSVNAMIKEVSPQVAACSPGYFNTQGLVSAEGRFISEGDVAEKRQVCILGDTIAKSLGADGRPGGYVRIERDLYKVIGVLKRFDKRISRTSAVATRDYNNMVFIPLPQEGGFQGARSLKEEEDRTLTEIVVQVSAIEHVLSSAEIARRTLEVTQGGVENYQIIVPLELLKQSRRTQRTFNIVIGSIACISLFVGGIGIMNIMLATVSERTREIGVRRALGASRRDIIIQFLSEAVLLTFAGGLVGVVAGWGAATLISRLAEWKTAFTALSILLPLVMSGAVGLFFGLYPAYLAAGMDPITALRHE